MYDNNLMLSRRSVIVIPGVDPESSVNSLVVINGCFLDSGSTPGMTITGRLLSVRLLSHILYLPLI